MGRHKAGKIPKGSGMPPRARQRDIAQRRRAKGKPIGFLPSHAEPPLIACVTLKTRRLARTKLRLAHGMKIKISQKGSTVTGRASRCAIKQLKPAHLRARKAAFTRQQPIKGRGI